jgi:hypothetical protein
MAINLAHGQCHVSQQMRCKSSRAGSVPVVSPGPHVDTITGTCQHADGFQYVVGQVLPTCRMLLDKYMGMQRRHMSASDVDTSPQHWGPPRSV